MSITPRFTRADVQMATARLVMAQQKAILLRLQQAGEMFIAMARTSGNYTDQTGNLRASVGYMIFYNGRIVGQGFPGNHPLGVEKGKSLARKYGLRRGCQLVGVAGMDYASAVEARGKDVITGSSLIVEEWLKMALAA